MCYGQLRLISPIHCEMSNNCALNVNSMANCWYDYINSLLQLHNCIFIFIFFKLYFFLVFAFYGNYFIQFRAFKRLFLLRMANLMNSMDNMKKCVKS